MMTDFLPEDQVAAYQKQSANTSPPRERVTPGEHLSEAQFAHPVKTGGVQAALVHGNPHQPGSVEPGAPIGSHVVSGHFIEAPRQGVSNE